MPAMTDAQLEAWADAAAAVLALPIAAEHRPGVLRYLGLAAGMAELVMAVPLEAADEPAFAFTPIGPDDLP
jgi:hypothetical protein